MKPERWNKIESIFHKALDAEESRRGAVLEESCAGDEDLRREVESLLAQHENAGNFIETPAFADAGTWASGQSILVGLELGHYSIVEKIGAGGVGEVYRARDAHLARDVAIKVLPPGTLIDESARKHFHKEALILSQLNHPNIATIHDFDTQQGVDFLVMEYIPGITLSEKVAAGPLPEKEVLRLGVQLAEGLSAAHEHGVVHRDLKPGNLRLTDDGRLKILDFGLAKLRLPVTASAVTESMTETQAGAGTLPYMAPEQLLAAESDARTDIHAAGSVLYEMATGQRPFAEVERSQLIGAILRRPPRPPTVLNPRLSPELGRIIGKCLEKEPENRYQSAKELAVDLRRLAFPTNVPGEVPTEGRLERRSTSLLRLIPVILGIVALLAAIGPIVWYSTSKPRKHQVVLMGDFNNRTDERVFDGTIPELLTVNLEQSGYISVFSSSRTSEVLRLMERAPNGSIDEATGREICQREALNAVILGSITKLGSRYVVTARAISPGGQSLASTEDIVSDAGELPASLDRISKYLRRALGESKQQIAEASIPVVEVTSASLEAIHSFSIGKQKLYAGSVQDARAYFDEAVRLDPSFAMAREYLGIAYLHQGNRARAEEELKKALPLIDHVTEQEKQKILGDYNFLRRDFDQAIVHYKRLKELRPLDSVPSLNLAQCFMEKLNFDSALAETKEAVQVEPAVGPENNLAEIYLLKGDFRDALSTAEGIMKKDPTNIRGLENSGWAYLLDNQSSEARHIFENMVELGGDAESRGRSALADIALSTGHYREAKRQLEAGIAVDRRLGNSFAASKKQILMVTSSLESAGRESLSDHELDQVGGDPQLLFLAGLFYTRANLRSELAQTCARLDALIKNNGVRTLQSFRNMLGAQL